MGPCHDIESRWYFDQTAGECQEFSYGGCEGNKNNFKTRESCEEICSSIGSGGVKGNEQTGIFVNLKQLYLCTLLHVNYNTVADIFIILIYQYYCRYTY